jgi:AcrR family transcriptional regulator
MQAMAAAILEHGEEGDSPALISRIANISERTLYRHYPTKKDLWDGFLDWVSNQVGMTEFPASEQELLEAIPEMFARFDEHDALIRACISAKAWSEVWIRGRNGWKDSVEAVIGGYAERDAALARQVGAVVQLLYSGLTWKAMRDWGLTSAEAAEATSWAIRVLLHELELRTR